jgi:hypothetical protein
MPVKSIYAVFLAAFAALLVCTSAAGQTATFGPKQYTRAAGPPQTFTETFSRCAGAPCQLVVLNGNADGSNRVSSASVSLNGVEILGPSSFNQNVGRIVRPVSLADNDQLTVSLKSKPGSFLTISVECASFAALRIADPGVVSSIWANGTVSFSIPLQNQGNQPAVNVSITGITAGSGNYADPTPFAYSAGTIDPEESQQIAAEFSGVDGHATLPLTVSGTYNFGPAACSFQTQASVAPPPASNGGTPKQLPNSIHPPMSPMPRINMFRRWGSLAVSLFLRRLAR